MAEKIETALDLVKRVVKDVNGLFTSAGALENASDFEDMNREAQARHGKLGRGATGTVSAYINHSRWVIDCPNCNSGIAGLPGVSEVVCLECGERYRVTFPQDRERIEEALLQRPRTNRHWRSGETADDLERENREHADDIRAILADEGIEATPEVTSRILRAINGAWTRARAGGD